MLLLPRRRFLIGAASLLGTPSIVRAQSVLPGFPPGMFQSRAALNGSGGGGSTATFDASSQPSGWSSGGNFNVSWTHTPAGTPSGIIVGFANYNGVNDTFVTSVTATYGGAAMGAPALTQAVYGVNGRFAMFGLASPLSGAQTAQLAFVTSGGTNIGFAFAMSVTGSDLATIFRATNGATATGTAISNTVAGSAANDLVVDFVAANAGTDTVSSPGAGQTSTTITARTDAKFSYKTAAGASVAMTWTLSPSDTWWSNAVSVKHA